MIWLAKSLPAVAPSVRIQLQRQRMGVAGEEARRQVYVRSANAQSCCHPDCVAHVHAPPQSGQRNMPEELLQAVVD